MERIKQLEVLLEVLGSEETLLAVVKALSDYQFDDIFKYICQCYDIEICEE